MMKLADLLKLNVQPSEEPKMKNYLKRASRDQADIFTTDHPENTNSSQRYNNGYPWSFDDPSGIFEDEKFEDLHRALIGREFQTLEDLAKMASRMRQRGFAQSEIEEFVLGYII
jgi:hypothetical protein